MFNGGLQGMKLLYASSRRCHDFGRNYDSEIVQNGKNMQRAQPRQE